MRLIELVVIVGAALVPIFILANEVSGDEFIKAAAGVLLSGTVAAIVAIYKVWKSNDPANDS